MKGISAAIGSTWALATVQMRVSCLTRNTFRFASKAYREELGRDLKPVYMAISKQDVKERFAELAESRDVKDPTIGRSWENA
jgi:putative transposase